MWRRSPHVSRQDDETDDGVFERVPWLTSKPAFRDAREIPVLDWALEGAQSACRVDLECSSRHDKHMGGGILGSTTQPSLKGRAPQRCPTQVEDLYREFDVKESKWLNSFMEHELNPPPAPPSYDVTPPNSREGTATPHFSSTSLRPKPDEGAIVAARRSPPRRTPPRKRVNACAHKKRMRASTLHHNIFACDSNAALLLLFSAATRAARLAAPDPLSARLLSNTLYATRAAAPTAMATYTRLIQL